MPNIATRFFKAGIQEVKTDLVRKLGGVSGTRMYGGYITDEDPINRSVITKTLDWDDPEQRADMVDEMLTDATITAKKNAINLPIKQAQASIEPASGEKAKNIDKKIAESLEEDLLKNPNFSFKELIEHLLTFPYYGNVVMIKNFERPDGLGRTRWKNFAYRKQRTIDRWDVDVLGNLNRVHQLATSVTGEMVDVWIPEKVPTSIMENPILHIAYEQLGDNFNGKSILRSAWVWHFIKRNALPKFGRQIELAATGIPHAKFNDGMPAKGSQEDTQWTNILKNVQRYLKSDDKVDMSIFGGKDFAGFNIPDAIRFCDQQMVKDMLAMFIEKPMQDTGAYAMQNSLFETFLNNLEGLANQIEDVFNEGRRGMQHVKQYVNLNWPNVTEYPKLRIAKVNSMSSDVLLNMVKLYVEAGGIMTEADWNYVRTQIGFNEIELKEFNEELDNPVEESMN